MKKRFLVIVLLSICVSGIQAQISNLHFVRTDISRIDWFEDGEITSSDTYSVRDDGTIQVEFHSYRHGAPYISDEYVWEGDKVYKKTYTGKNILTYYTVYTLDEKKRIINIDSTAYEDWGGVKNEVNSIDSMQYDSDGNLISVEFSSSEGWSGSKKYFYNANGKLQKIEGKGSGDVKVQHCIYTSENSYYIEPSNDGFFSSMFYDGPFEKPKLVYTETEHKSGVTKHTEYYNEGALVGEKIEYWENERLNELIYRRTGRTEKKWVFEYRAKE